MAQKSSRNRVHGDRLWDDGGQVWQRSMGSWLSAAEVEELLASGVGVVVQSFEGPMRWLTPSEGRREWLECGGNFSSRVAGAGPR